MTQVYASWLAASAIAVSCTLQAQAEDPSTPPADPEPVAAEASADSAAVAEPGTPQTVEAIPLADPSPPAVAEEPAERRHSALLDEIVVTAQKREENLADVPISINAFSGDQLEALGVTNTYDLATIVPGLQTTESVGFAVTYLRGVGTDAFLLADPSVALYVDDVYLPFSMAANQKFGKLARTEVLKGPQGTLFGRNAVGGAINVVTAKPDFDEFEVALDLEAGDYSKEAGKIYVNVPVLDNLALNFTALTDSRDSYYNGLQNVNPSNPDGDKVDGEDGEGYQAKLRYKPLDWIEFTVNGTWVREKGTSGLYSPNDNPSPASTALGARAQPGFDDTVTSDPAFLKVKNNIYSTAIKFTFEPLDVKVLGSKQHVVSSNSIDFDGTPQALVGFNVLDNHGYIDTAELQLLSNPTSWGAENWSWIVGSYYYHSVQSLTGDAIIANSDASMGTLFGVPLADPSGPAGIFLDALSALPIPIPNGQLIFTGALATNSVAGFVQTTYKFTDWFSATLGARYQDETRGIIESVSHIEDMNGGRGTPVVNSNDKSLYPDIRGKKFGPKLTLEFRPADGVLAFVSWQEAQKSGTYNAINLIDQAEPVKAEDITAYEVGTKIEWFDGLLKTSGGVFYYDQKNLQVQLVSLLAGGAISFENAPKASVKGVDFDLVADVFPSTFSGLYLTASGAYIKAKLDSYPDGSGFDRDTGVFSDGNDYSGNIQPRSPKTSGRLGLNKIFSFDASSLEVAGDYYYNDGYFTAASNNPATRQDRFELLNARTTYNYEPWNLTLTGYVRNIKDKEYSISKLNNDFGTITGLAAPRTYGLLLGWRY